MSPTAHKPDSNGYTRGAGEVRCGADQEAGRRPEGEGGRGETGGEVEKSKTGMIILLSVSENICRFTALAIHTTPAQFQENIFFQ